MKTKVDCHECDGSGGVYYSCCGDAFEESPDSDICPTCHEHCGDGDFERCEACHGNGHIFEVDTVEEYERELERIDMLKADHKETVDRGSTGNWKVASHPPRDMPEGTAYYNTEDGRLWQLSKSSWTPMEGRVDQQRLPVTRLVPAVADESFKDHVKGYEKLYDSKLIDELLQYPVTPAESYKKSVGELRAKYEYKPPTHSMGFVDFGDPNGPKFRRLDPLTDKEKEKIFDVEIKEIDLQRINAHSPADIAEVLKRYNDMGVMFIEPEKTVYFDSNKFKTFTTYGATKNNNKDDGDYSIFDRRGTVDLQGPDERNW